MPSLRMSLLLLALGAVLPAISGRRLRGKANKASLAYWMQSKTVDEVDYSKDPHAARKLVASRLPTDPPLVIRNAMGGDELKVLMQFSQLDNIKTILPVESGRPTWRQCKTSTAKSESSGPFFSHWTADIEWRGSRWMDEGAPGSRSEWHSWEWQSPQYEEFAAQLEPGAPESKPYRYWTMQLPDNISAIDPKEALCARFASQASQDECLGTNIPLYIWASSPGMKAITHFDREQNINMQLTGEKKWTFWHPSMLSDLCLHPYIHPANRQMQGPGPNTDGGAFSGCPSAKALHARTTTLHGGDVVLVSGFYCHHVEYPQNAIAIQFNFNDAMVKAHDKVVDELLNWAKNRQQDVAAQTASAMLRLTLRTLIMEVLGKPRLGSFLAEHWAQHVTLLQSHHLFAAGGAIAKLCAAEQELTQPQRHKAIQDGQIFARPFQQYPRWLQEEELRYVLGTVLSSPSNRIDNTFGSRDIVRRAETHKWFKAIYLCIESKTKPRQKFGSSPVIEATATDPSPSKATYAGIIMDEL